MNKRNIYILITVLAALALFLAGCGKTASAPETRPAPEAPAAAAPAPAEPPAPPAEEPAPAEMPVPESSAALTGEELQAFTDLFETPEYHGFLEEAFNGPADISWEAVLRSGAGIAVPDVGEEETAAYLKATGQKKLYGGLLAVRRNDLTAYMRQHTGVDLTADEKTLPAWDYISERDTFYRLFWGDEHVSYTCVSGEKTGDRYALLFTVNEEGSAGVDPRGHYGMFADRVLTLTQSGDGYAVESNMFRWDDGCDEAQTFDVELPQFDGPVRFITYSVDPAETRLYIVKEGKLLTQLSTYIEADTLAYLTKVIAVGFFDFNADGSKDIVVIGDSDYGQRTLLYEATADKYYFANFADLDADRLAAIGADFTIGGIRSALLGDNRDAVYGSWQEAYAQIAKVCHIANDGYRYDLIRADGDDIPELVVSYPGYMTSLYTYENDHARCLMNHWPYGAGGNSGYTYVPGMNIYYNGNADYAGAVYYESYMSGHDAGEIETDYWVKHLNFNDLDGDGEPSPEELAVSGEYVGTAEYHNETGTEMTEEEIKAMVDLYDSYEKEFLIGDLDYTGLLAQLNG